jgi:phage-related protein
MNPVAQAAGGGALEAGKAISSAIPAINEALASGAEFFANTIGMTLTHELAKWESRTIAAFAQGAGEFFNSWQGFMAGSASIVGGAITGSAGILDAMFKTNMSEGAKKIADGFVAGASMAGQVFGTIFSAIAKLFDPAFIQGLADQLSGLVEQLPELLMKAFEALAGAMEKVIKSLPEIVGKLMDSLSSILDRLISQIPALIDSLAAALGKFLEKLPELTGKIFAALPSIISKFLSVIPGLITAIFKAIPQIIAQFIKAVPGILVAIINAIPSIVLALVEGIIGAMGEIVASLLDFLLGGGLEQIAGAFLKMIPKLAVALVNGVLNGLKRGLGAIFGGFKIKGGALAEVASLPEKFAKGVKDLGKSVAKEASQVFKVLDLNSAAQAASRLGAAKNIPDAAGAATKLLEATVTGIWTKFLAALEKIWNWIFKLLRPIFDSLTKIWDDIVILLKKTWEGLMKIFEAVWAAVQVIWDGMMKILEAVWHVVEVLWDGMMVILKAAWHVVEIIWDGMMAILEAAWHVVEVIWDGMMKILSAAWNAVMKIFSSAWEGVKRIWQILMDVFSGKTKILDGIRQLFAVMFETASKALTAVWDYLKVVFEEAGKVITAVWDYLKVVFEEVGKVITAVWDSAKVVFEEIGKALTAVWDYVKVVFEEIGKALTAVFNVAKVWFDEIINFFGNLGTTIWNGLKAGFEGGNKLFGGIGTKIWEGLKSGLNGLGKIFTDLFNDLNPSNLLSKMFKFDGGGKGDIENALSRITGGNFDVPFTAFAKGGLVPGTPVTSGDSAMNDRILALLSPGEAVVPRSVMENEQLAKVVRSIISGDFKPPAFARGGTLGKLLGGNVKGAAKDVAGGVSETASILSNPQKMWDLFKDKALRSLADMVDNMRFHSGGMVPGGGEGGDVPAMLQAGEFVINRRATSSVGSDFLANVNRGSTGSNTTVNMEISVAINASSQSLDETYIRTKLIPSVKEEFKKASLRGDFLMSDRGLRRT